MDDETLSTVGQKIAEQILKAEPEAFALVVSVCFRIKVTVSSVVVSCGAFRK